MTSKLNVEGLKTILVGENMDKFTKFETVIKKICRTDFYNILNSHLKHHTWLFISKNQ